MQQQQQQQQQLREQSSSFTSRNLLDISARSARASRHAVLSDIATGHVARPQQIAFLAAASTPKRLPTRPSELNQCGQAVSNSSSSSAGNFPYNPLWSHTTAHSCTAGGCMSAQTRISAGRVFKCLKLCGVSRGGPSWRGRAFATTGVFAHSAQALGRVRRTVPGAWLEEGQKLSATGAHAEKACSVQVRGACHPHAVNLMSLCILLYFFICDLELMAHI